jgi:hypothetical protein
MNIKISTTYSCYIEGFVDLGDHTFDDIKDWYIKWHTFHYTFDGTAWLEEEIGGDIIESVDMKRPLSTEIYSEDEADPYYED